MTDFLPLGQVQRAQSLTQLATARLRQAITDGTIPLGALLSEKQIAAMLGMSKTPVREAFQQLQLVGLIEVLPQKGGRVFKPTAEQVRALCEVRLDLERTALGHAMARNQRPLADALSVLVDRMNRKFDVKKPLEYQRADNLFHYSFFEHCGNDLLRSAYDLFYPRICAIRTHLSTPQETLLLESRGEHEVMLKHVIDGDVLSAQGMLEDHIARTATAYLAQI